MNDEWEKKLTHAPLDPATQQRLEVLARQFPDLPRRALAEALQSQDGHLERTQQALAAPLWRDAAAKPIASTSRAVYTPPKALPAAKGAKGKSSAPAPDLSRLAQMHARLRAEYLRKAAAAFSKVGGFPRKLRYGEATITNRWMDGATYSAGE